MIETDTKLMNGDHALDPRGVPAVITGGEEILQRALIRLTVPKGSLPGLPAFGSELRRLRSARRDTLGQLARSYVQEALGPLQGCAVSEVGAAREGDVLTVAVTLTHHNTPYHLEVTV